MPFQVIYDKNHHLIECHVQGAFDWTIPEEMLPEVVKLAISHQCHHVLVDVRESRMDLSTLRIFQTPEKVAAGFAKNGVDGNQVKRAFLLAEPDQGFEFLETVFINQHQSAKIFYDKSEAIQWLKI